MASFFLADFLLLAFLILIEILFSADNLLAISTLSSKLAPHQQKKALWTGFTSGLVLRCLAIIFFTYLIHYPSIQLIGAFYLIIIGGKEWIFPQTKQINKPSSFWETVFHIEVTDVLFAIDSILAAFAILTSQYGSSKVWMIYVSSLLGMFIMRFAASKMVKIFAKFPGMGKVSHLLIIWIGIKFCIEALPHYFPSLAFLYMTEYYSFIFWIGCAIVILCGFKSQHKPL